MRILVQKFGGTSVADIDRLKMVRGKVKAALDQGYKVVVVLSAKSGKTNKLLDLSTRWAAEPDLAEVDSLLSTGEQASIALFSMLLKDSGIKARSMLGWQIPIITNDEFGRARILSIDASRIHKELEAHDVLVVAGFQGSTEDGRITTLGRGGSDTSAVALAARLLQQGELVALPTETVYGIAADARNGEAVSKIFVAKGRPQDNPLIVHVTGPEMLHGLVSEVPERAQLLMAAFCPGPLTIIMPRGPEVAAECCAGLDTVGIRMPSHPVARAVIEASGCAFAAPSANLSGKPSPTNAQDVFTDMDGRLPLILDGGECDWGVESTVVSVVGEKPTLFRPGHITLEDLERALGEEVEVSKAILEKLPEGAVVRSPGMKYKHYAPKADVTLLDGTFEQFKAYVDAHAAERPSCLCFTGEAEKLGVPCVEYGREGDGADQARHIFRSLRALDEQGDAVVYARCPQKDGLSMAVYNRLIRAAAFRVIEL